MKRTLTIAALAGVAIGLSITPVVIAEGQNNQTKSEKKAEGKPIDPVCGMVVDPKTAEKSVYKGKTYYFCARSEKEAFDKSPEKYIKKKGMRCCKGSRASTRHGNWCVGVRGQLAGGSRRTYGCSL